MNILIPYPWLKEHLRTPASAEELQRALSLCGPSVERIERRENEPVFDIEVTTNRVDTFSVRGIAREAAVILPQFGLEAELIPLAAPLVSDLRGKEALPMIKNDPALNRRVLMVRLNDVKHTPTPDWMARRLRQTDMNVHDSVIDITNYVTHELGHPCHAFDADKITKLGGEIIVKIADAGKPFTTLDGESYTTVGGEVVFENPAGEIIDLPGIKGTANTAVDDQTENVLFFIESILPEKIRFASMTHAIRTQAAQINEKDIDPNLADEVLRRAVQLYQELTGAQLGSDVSDTFPGKKNPTAVSLPLERVTDYLGISLPGEQVGDILQKIGCEVAAGKKALIVTPPTYRPDLTIPADLIEEVARIYGYHNLPSVLMPTSLPTEYPAGTDFPREEQTQQLLADLGYQELFTYSLVSEELARQADPELQRTLALRNPLTSDAAYLRRALLPSHLDTMARQLSAHKLRGTFELANVYWKEGNSLPDEHLVLAVLDRDLRALRTTLETLCRRLYIEDISVVSAEGNTKIVGHEGLFYSSYAFITHGDRVLGTLGYLQDGLVGAELQWREVLAAARRYPQYRSIPVTAPYFEDITLTLPEQTPVGPVMDALRSAAEAIRAVTLLDRYQNRWTFRLQYWDYQKQIDAEQAQKLRALAITAAAKLGAELAG